MALSRCSPFRHLSPAPAPTACTPAFAGMALTTRCLCLPAVRAGPWSRSCAGRPIQTGPCFETPSRQAICALPHRAARAAHHDEPSANQHPNLARPLFTPQAPRLASPSSPKSRICEMERAGTLIMRARRSQPPPIITQRRILRCRPKSMIDLLVPQECTNPGRDPGGPQNGSAGRDRYGRCVYSCYLLHRPPSVSAAACRLVWRDRLACPRRKHLKCDVGSIHASPPSLSLSKRWTRREPSLATQSTQ
jgi:hypothetical protein